MKVFISGNTVEIYQYEKSIIDTIRSKGGGRKYIYEASSEHEEENRKVSIKRALNKFNRLYWSNFAGDAGFVTLTFDPKKMPHTTDLSECKHKFDIFIKKVKRRHLELKYLAVTEFQDKNDTGAIHFHMITDYPAARLCELQDLWFYGFIKFNNIKNDPEAVLRISSYMCKGFNDPRLNGCHKYLRSKNLRNPIELRGIAAELELLEYGFSDESLVTSYTFETGYLGQMQYDMYRINRNQDKMQPKGLTWVK
jgi:hypothetical protein